MEYKCWLLTVPNSLLIRKPVAQLQSSSWFGKIVSADTDGLVDETVWLSGVGIISGVAWTVECVVGEARVQRARDE